MIKKFHPFIKENLQSDKVVISKINIEDVQKCIDMKYELFKSHYGSKEKHDNRMLNQYDLNYSLIAKLDNQIVGFYFFKKTKFPNLFVNFYKFTESIKSKTGLKGLSLFVKPKFRDKGIGKLLINYYKDVKDEDVNFIWGGAFHELNNLSHWEKRRILFADIFGVYYSIDLLGSNDIIGDETDFYKSYKNNKFGKKVSNFTAKIKKYYDDF